MVPQNPAGWNGEDMMVTKSRHGWLLALALATCGCSGGSDSSYGPTTPVARELDSPTLNGGQTFEHTFASAGTFPYHCERHPATMRGNEVVVNAGAADTLVEVLIVGTASPGFAPSSVMVKPGGKVRWTNSDVLPHTVTSD